MIIAHIVIVTKVKVDLSQSLDFLPRLVKLRSTLPALLLLLLTSVLAVKTQEHTFYYTTSLA